MIQERPLREPSEVIIPAATAALAVVLAFGIAFGLWRGALMHTVSPRMLTAGISAAGIGVGLIGYSLPGTSTRLFLMVFGPMLTIALLLGKTIFGALIH